jgi:hypothetical protein
VPKKDQESKPAYIRSPKENEAVAKVFSKRAVPRLKISESTLTPDHPDARAGLALIIEAIGTTDPDFGIGILKQLAHAGSGKSNQERVDFMLAAIEGIKPQDHIEVMLATHMAMVHSDIMKISRDLHDAQLLIVCDATERIRNRLMRVFMNLVETLKRYRTGGQQTVTVTHVSVNEGGQAIVGSVSQTHSRDPAPAQPPALAHDETLPMPDLRESKIAVPIEAPSSKKE